MKRKTSSLRLIVSILFLIVTFICTTYTFSYAEKSFLWRVQSKRSTVYILGSIHLLKKDIYPLSRTIENAFEKSDVLAVEADINDIGRLNIQKLMESAFYSGNDTLEKHVSRSTFDTIKEQTERLGLPVEFVYNQKPWFLGLTLSSVELMKAGYDPNYGMDKYFLSKAAGTKKILELESLDYQIDLLSGLNDDEQELFLLYTLKDLKILTQEVDNLVEAWQAGAVESMERTVTKSFTEDRRFSGIYDKLIYKRNRNMALKIEGFLKTNGNYFVVVGAAHLLGDRGIVQLLKGRGYSVEQL
ncbi:MAG: TraB/GumN family protein [Deltaproteobacteria bacterium]|nr:TraB/GumN family protein [Deltaproteobacteria bacterium]